jgi:glycosyltransferase involved in cell wall biosynthesis
VDAETAGALFAASRTLVQCSDSESFGMSVAEALAAGLPVVVTNETPWPQVATLELGYSVAQEPAAIARGILEILERPADGCAMGARGKAWARETFGWGAIGRSMRDAYQGVLEKPRGLRA